MPLVKCLTAPSIRCFPCHYFAPLTFLLSPCVRLSPAKAQYPDIQAREVYEKAVSEENQREQPSNSSTDDYSNRDVGSSSPSALYFLAPFFFILGARRRRERRQYKGQQDKSVVDENEEVDFRSVCLSSFSSIFKVGKYILFRRKIPGSAPMWSLSAYIEMGKLGTVNGRFGHDEKASLLRYSMRDQTFEFRTNYIH